jgi:hypothetical protein
VTGRLHGRLLLLIVPLLAVAACGGDDDAGAPDWVGDIRRAVAAVENERGEGQEYFEVTANQQLTNVFVSVENGAVAVPYLFVDGVLEDPAPPLGVAGGHSFRADAIALDEDLVLAAILTELPSSTVDALSVEGGPDGSVRYVASVRSEVGGVLDVVVGADGSIISVTPL